MDLSWTPELENLRAEVREFALAEIAPIAVEHDNLQKFPIPMGPTTSPQPKLLTSSRVQRRQDRERRRQSL